MLRYQFSTSDDNGHYFRGITQLQNSLHVGRIESGDDGDDDDDVNEDEGNKNEEGIGEMKSARI